MTTTTLTPSGVSLTLTGDSSSLLTTLFPVGDSWTLTGGVPIPTQVVPAGDTATLTGGTSVVVDGVNPAGVALTLTEGTSTLSGATNVLAPDPAALTVTEGASDLRWLSTLTPDTLPATLTGGVPNVLATATTCADIWDATKNQILVEERLRRSQPVGRIWDAEWNCQFVMGNEYSAQFSWISNDTGPGQTEFPMDSELAQWIYDYQGRMDAGSGRSVCITIDYCGARWSGVLDKYAVEQREDGDTVLVVDWVHDYEHLKWYSVWSNPVLPSAFQFPRAWVLAGPVRWVLKLTLWFQLWREHNPFLTWPDDPLDLANWITMGLDMSDWHMVVKPTSFLQAMFEGDVWTVASSRWANFHDMAHPILEDAELSVVCRRYLPGDPPPWPGAHLRYGTLVIDFVDKSGIMIGTSHGGSIFDGLVRTVLEFADDFIDSTIDTVADNDIPANYFLPGSRYTDPVRPYVIFYEGDESPIQTSSWVYSPSKAVQIEVGGHSSPGVNEAISATIQAVGDILGGLAQIGSLGGTIDTLLKPLYEDTILAWQNYTSNQRSINTGWERFFSYFQDGANKAFTIAALMVIRAGMWATKTVVSWRVQVADGAPYLIGDNGVGHFFLDDRVGLVLKADNKIHMDRCRKIDLQWGPDSPPEWNINIGDDRIWQDPAQRALGRIERLIAGLHDLGVW